jgi:hypothetical protein
MSPLIICASLFIATIITRLGIADGVFSYATDNPYFRMAHARNLAHSHHSANGEEASPLSSNMIGLPLLLSFARLHTFARVPQIYAGDTPSGSSGAKDESCGK